MIERYSRPKMASIWSLEAQFRTWLDIEILVCEGWEKLGKITKDALKEIKEKAYFTTEEVLEEEKKTKHDVAAFVSVVQKHIGQAGRFLHMGLTSSDILDTAYCYRLKISSQIILEELERCLEITKERAIKEKNVSMIGRTHGIHAEPITMGLKWLLWHDMFKRAKNRILSAQNEISIGKISGVVGTYAHVPPQVEEYVCNRLGLKVDTISTQVISRDRFAFYYCSLALLGSVVETIATELRHLQRTEVSEVREKFSKGQKGSSAMPHKRNPISAENLTGLSRMLRSMVLPALENCALWHERDISHSSVERIIGPDGNILADYMLSRLYELLSCLEIDALKMEENMDLLHGTIYSQSVLLALINEGMERDKAYEIVQKQALLALDLKKPFKTLLENDEEVCKKLSKKTLDMIFSPSHYYSYLDYLYKKVLQDEY